MSNPLDRTIDALQEALAYKQGNLPNVKQSRIEPADIDVKSLRNRLKLSQTDFAKRYGFSLSTLRNWEQGRRQPEGPALILLKVIDKEPKVVEQALQVVP